MREALREWAGHVAALVFGTLKVWLATLPQLLAILAVAWTTNRMLEIGAAWAGPVQPWASVAMISVSFVVILSGTVVALRTIGQELGLFDLVPHAADEDRTVSHQLAVTLLPFLGIYAVFGTVQDAAQSVVLEGFVISNDVYSNVLGKLDPRTMRDAWIVLGVGISAYVLRRLIDIAYERTGIRLLGFGAALLEGFFMLTVILSGTRLIANVTNWLRDRQFMDWLDAGHDGASIVASWFKIDLPAVVTFVWHWVVEVGWPKLLDVVAQPVLWLAVAALVFGSGVLTVADIWRRGEAPTVVAQSRRHGARVLGRQLSHATGTRRVLIEVQEAFFGDVDDKYLPTWQSLRLILRTGATFLGAYVLIYAGVTAMGNLVNWGLRLAVGGNTIQFWSFAGPLVNLVHLLAVEPLRLALLGVAFHRTLVAVMDVDGSPASPITPVRPPRSPEAPVTVSA